MRLESTEIESGRTENPAKENGPTGDTLVGPPKEAARNRALGVSLAPPKNAWVQTTVIFICGQFRESCSRSTTFDVARISSVLSEKRLLCLSWLTSAGGLKACWTEDESVYNPRQCGRSLQS